jgi:hypothetical protein
MKYLKLKTQEKFPTTTESKEGHITFAYFGKASPSQESLKILKNLKPFTLRKLRSDNFGPNNDIPVVVYEIIEDNPEIHTTRSKIISNLPNQFEKWNPHISNVDYHQCPEIIHVIGIEGNDQVFLHNL